MQTITFEDKNSSTDFRLWQTHECEIQKDCACGQNFSCIHCFMGKAVVPCECTPSPTGTRIVSNSRMVFAGIVILIFSIFCNAQKVEVDQDFIDDAAKAFQLVVAQRDQIEKQEKQIADLQKLVEAIERSQRTPCTLQFEKVKQDLTFWLEKLGTDETKNREILKILKDVRKQGRAAINRQCGTESSSMWKLLWEGVKVAVPITAAVLIAND